MVKLRGLSFISNLKKRDSSPDPSSIPPLAGPPTRAAGPTQHHGNDEVAPPPPPPHHHAASSARANPPPEATRPGRSSGRPQSALFPNNQVPLMDVDADPLPELEPIFGYLNSQMGKLYHEGYLLRLDDLDNQGRPYSDRQWVECFAQLIGSVLWMWDAAALDEAGGRADVHPSHINVADATVKMVEALPTRFADNRPLQNVLSISTAGKNRYLLHFNSVNSLTQWTAAIRLTMYENTLLQESYTGALIAGKGKSLNNMRAILEKTRFKYEDWVRVRFSPGTPWKRCWCVITQPDEKAVQKLHKAEKKKKSSYDRPPPPIKGTIKFYATKKTKKTTPLVTVTDAYSAFAIYPQSRPLIEQSTLIKLEGQIKVHAKVESVSEGFVFVLPELHPAVSGVEIMFRWLFPVYDAFSLYGRPIRLLADTVSTRSLMFAMPKGKRAAYLDNLDVANLIHTDGSANWSEQEWRKRLKDATARRIASKNSSRQSSVRGGHKFGRSSLPQSGTAVHFGDSGGAPTLANNRSTDAVYASGYRNSAGPAPGGQRSSDNPPGHYGSNGYGQGSPPSSTSLERTVPEENEEHSFSPSHSRGVPQYDGSYEDVPSRNGSSSESSGKAYPNASSEKLNIEQLKPSPQPSPVILPPAFAHSPGEVPENKPQPSPDLKRANSRVSYGTLSQMAEMSNTRGGMAAAGAAAAWNGRREPASGDSESKFAADGPVLREEDEHPGLLPPANISDGPYTPVSPVSPLPGSRDPNASGHTHSTSIGQVSPIASPKAVTARKPVPQHVEQQVQQRMQQPARDDDARSRTDTESSLGSLRHAIDVDALNHVMTRERTPSPQKRPVPVPDEESNYDQSSVASPDYASSYRSSNSKHSSTSVPRPRMGVMKVVGTQEPKADEVMIGDTRFQPGTKPEKPDSDLPLVDFGPTHAYNPTTRRPSTSETLTMFGHNRNTSDATLTRNERKTPSPGRPLDGGMGGRRTDESPAREERRRSVLWQPGMVPDGRKSPGPGITPERYVQQRAEDERVGSPPYAHRRGRSRATPSPRPQSGDWTATGRQQSRPQSGDWTANHRQQPRPQSGDWAATQRQQPRPQSGDWTANHRQQAARDMPQRPNSRGANAALNQTDISPRLSAREQEHIARVTGSSFFDLSNQNSKSPQVVGPGLVSAIDARERERQAMKEGVSGHMVQQAIAQRQYQSQLAGSPQTQYPPTPPSTYPPNAYRQPAYTNNYNNGPIPYNQLPQQQLQWGQQAPPSNQPSPYYQTPPPPPVHQENPYFR